MGLLNALLSCVVFALGVGLGWVWRGKRDTEDEAATAFAEPVLAILPASNGAVADEAVTNGSVVASESSEVVKTPAPAEPEPAEGERLRVALAAQEDRARVAWEEVRRLRQDGVRQAGELRESQERTQAQVRATLRARDVAREAEEARDALAARVGPLEISERAARAELTRLERELAEARQALAGADEELARLREPPPAPAPGEVTPQPRSRGAAKSAPAPGQRVMWSD